MKKRSHRLEKMARVYDSEILPVWSERFARMIFRGLSIPEKATILEIGCSTGYVCQELLKRADHKTRIVAIDPISPLLDVARRKVGALYGKRVFLRSDALTAKLSFASEVYDLVLSNLGLLQIDMPALAIEEFTRVTRCGGNVIFTLPLEGTYREFFDLFREVISRKRRSEISARLEEHVAKIPSSKTVLDWCQAAGLEDVEVDVREFSLLFKSSREFFFAPVIDYGPLSDWKD